jgi:uncharacterized alpha-E superfamily protein
MISRVAESCFWLHRYMERVGSTARVLDVNHETVLDASLQGIERWRPTVIVMGEQQRFEEIVGTDAYADDDTAEDYLAWHDQNPASIKSSLFWARENARTIREVISREMWELLNTDWRWLNTAGRREYRQDRSKFYARIRSLCSEFQGLLYETLLHGEAFDFMRLGTLIERADQTARVMDVRHHWLSEEEMLGPETPEQAAHWVGLLRLCSALEPFFKENRAEPTGPSVASFLLKDPRFPRSIAHCYSRLSNFLERIDGYTLHTQPSRSHALALGIMEELQARSIEEILEGGLHQELTKVIIRTAELGDLLHEEFFDVLPDGARKHA